MTFRLVDDPPALAGLMAEVAGETSLAIDTEAASFHRYHDRIYLIQLSTPSLTAVIDPLGVGDLGAIGTLLADPAIEKIFHDGDYDLRLFDKDLHFHARSLFDTRIAAQFVNEPGIGLGALLEKYFGIRPDKRFQRADWSARPLSAGMLEYASGDTDHLHELRDILRAQLVDLGRLEWVEEEFERLERIRWTGGENDPETAYLKPKGAKALPRRALAILRELYNWRDGVASGLDRALFRVLGNEVLFDLAEHPVGDVAALARVKGMNRDLAEKRGQEMLAAIERGLAIPEERLPRVPRGARFAPDPAFEARVEALKKVRNAFATELSLAPGVLCPNGILEAVARSEPKQLAELAAIPDVRRWQVKVLGPALLEAIGPGAAHEAAPDRARRSDPWPLAAHAGRTQTESTMTPPSNDVARKALKAVKDPELGLNIIDIGLVYDVTVSEEGKAHVQMTLTSPGCPAGTEIMDDVRKTLNDLEGITDVEVELVWEPYWTPDRMDPRVRAFLGH